MHLRPQPRALGKQSLADMQRDVLDFLSCVPWMRWPCRAFLSSYSLFVFLRDPDSIVALLCGMKKHVLLVLVGIVETGGVRDALGVASALFFQRSSVS